MSSTLLVNKNRLIELLGHSDKRVRDQSAKALGDFFPYSTGVIAPLIEAINKYKDESLSLTANIKKFIPSDKEFSELIKLFNKISQNKDENSRNISWHIQLSLLDFPIEILTDNSNTIKFNKNLTKYYDIAINREKIKSQKSDDLWNFLRNHCNQEKNDNLDKESFQNGQLYTQGLLRHKEHIKHKVIMYLSKETEVDYYLEDYLVQLSGDLKLEESVPYLFKLLKNTDFMDVVHSNCIKALEKIGGTQIVDYIDNDWSNEALRSEYSSILGSIPFDYSEELLIRCLNNETDNAAKTFLCGALCDIFSKKGVELVLNIIKKREYDPQIMSILNHLLPVCVYHGITLHDKEQIEKEQDQFKKASWKESPLYETSEKLKSSLDQLVLEQEANEFTKESISSVNTNNPVFLGNTINNEVSKNKIGRNDVCSCGSGKKYKKCCLINF